jgi:hypothetical protein
VTTKLKKAILVVAIVSLLLVTVVGVSCDVVSKYVGDSVDVTFRDLHHEQYDGVVSWQVVERGLISDTVDLHFWDGRVVRLHYVTSVEVIQKGF